MLLLAALTGCESGQGPGEVMAGWFDGLGSPPPAQVAADAFDPDDPDKRRESIILLANASWGGEEPYLKAYRELTGDPDPTVRAAAVSALGRHGEPADATLLTERLVNDESKIVRWEAARALQKIHHPEAIDPLIRALGDDADADVRMTAAQALAQYPRRQVFDALVGALNDENFAVVTAAHESLKTLTGRDLPDRTTAWWQWAQERENLFADGRPYYYQPYHRPPGMLDRMQFWKDSDAPRLQPRGLESADAEPDPGQRS
jgi:HEAT repeat protein